MNIKSTPVNVYYPLPLDQVIVNKGDIGHHMYFVQMGEIEVLPDEDSQPVAVFKEGDIFGEVCLCVHAYACVYYNSVIVGPNI